MAASGSEATARFSLDFDGNAGQFANDTTRALQGLQDKIKGDTDSLRAMQKALRDLQGGSAVNIKTARDLKDRIAAQKASIAAATQSYISLGGTFKNVAKNSTEAAKGFGSLGDVVKGSPGPLGNYVSKFSSLGELLAGGAIASPILLIAAAIVAMNVAMAAGLVMLAKFGIGQADARRSELLHLDALTKLRFGWMGMAGAFGPAADKASFLQSTIDSVSQSTALGRDQVASYAESLYKMGLRSGNLQAALEGVTTVAATQGETAAAAFQSMAAGAAYSGQSVRKLADDVKARLGGIAQAQLLSLDVQTRKLHANFAYLFSGLKIDGFLKALKSVTDLFSVNTATGRALKAILETVLQPLIDQVSGPAGMLVKRFFQGTVIGALLLALTVVKVRNVFKRTFGHSDLLKDLDITRMAVMAGAFAVAAFAGALASAAVGAAVLAGLLLLPIAVIGGLIYALVKVEDTINGLAAAAGSAAFNFVAGLVKGIESGASWVIQAVEHLAGSAMTAFREKLGIHSPSRIAMRAAIEVPRGVAVGIRAGQPEVERATRQLVSLPTSMAEDTPPAIANGRSAGGASASRSVHIGEINVHGAGNDGQSIAAIVVQEINKAFGGANTSIGAAVP